MNKQASVIAAILSLSLVSSVASAAVSSQQVTQIKPGTSKTEVLAQLGQADWNPTWLNGSSSLVYSLSDNYNPSVRAYVDLRGDKVTSVQFYDEQTND